MKITFVNHSSFIVEHDGKTVLCDPWFEGTVFNNGWKLYAPTLFPYDDFKNIDYIWFSHEHPDHFFPPNLKKIKSEYKENITILFQNTIDKRVKNYCKNTGFKDVIELKKNNFFEITPEFKVLCEHFQEGDSWVCFKSPETSILNTNDCGIININDTKRILRKVGNVDVLMTQFSYAYWAGNPEDIEYRMNVAKEKLKGLKFQCDHFNPKVIIPIASYVYFCHEENKYLNDSINTASSAYKYITDNVNAEPVILYNGEEYTFPETHDSEKSIKKFNDKLDAALQDSSSFLRNNPIELSKLTKVAERFISNLNTTNLWFVKSLLKPTYIQFFETNDTYILSLNGFCKADSTPSRVDVILSTECLLNCFEFPYGLDSVQISGRLRKPNGGKYSNFYNFFRIDHLKMRGINPNSINYILGAAFRKVLFKVGILKN